MKSIGIIANEIAAKLALKRQQAGNADADRLQLESVKGIGTDVSGGDHLGAACRTREKITMAQSEQPSPDHQSTSAGRDLALNIPEAQQQVAATDTTMQIRRA